MTNEETSRIPLHAWRINLDEEWEVRFWSRKLNCTEKELREAIAEVGPLAAAVQDYLRKVRDAETS